MDKIAFAINVPRTLAFRSLEGTARESQFGGTDHFFQTDAGVFYVSAKVGAIITEQLKKLEVKPGELVEVCKAHVDDGRGRVSTRWIVSFPAQDAADPPPAADPAPRRPVAVAGTLAASGVAPVAPVRPVWASVLIAQTTAVVDAYAAVLKHASDAHGNMIRPDDVRSLMTTVFINLAKQGVDNRNAA